jgi:hypothetical protein
LIKPLEGLHSQLIKYSKYPEGKAFPYGSGTNRKLAEQDCRKYEDTYLYRLHAIELRRDLCDSTGAPTLKIEVHLTDLGRRLLAALDQGLVWNVSVEMPNPVQTKYHWLCMIRDNVVLNENQLKMINGLPDDGNYVEVKGALTYWLLTATPHSSRTEGAKNWVQTDENGVVDHKWPGRRP